MLKAAAAVVVVVVAVAKATGERVYLARGVA